MYFGNNYRLERKEGNTFSVFEKSGNAYIHCCIIRINQRITHKISAENLDKIVSYYLALNNID